MARTLTDEIVLAAIAGFEAQRGTIDAKIAELRQMLKPVREAGAAPSKALKRKRRLSAAGRKAIGDAARRRWAAVNAAKAEQAGAADKPAKKSKAKKVAK